MSELEEIKAKLDELYAEYKSVKPIPTLKEDKLLEVANLLVEMTFVEDKNFSELFNQIDRFSADVTGWYFEQLIEEENCTVSLLNDVLSTLVRVKYPSKFAAAIRVIIENRWEETVQLTQLSNMFCFIADAAIKNVTKYNKIFQRTLRQTEGKIYLLDYTKLSRGAQKTIWDATKQLDSDLKKKYAEQIQRWAERYGFSEGLSSALRASFPEEKATNAERVSIPIVTEKPTSEIQKIAAALKESEKKPPAASSLVSKQVVEKPVSSQSELKPEPVKNKLAEPNSISNQPETTELTGQIHQMYAAVQKMQIQLQQVCERSEANQQLSKQIEELEQQLAASNETIRLLQTEKETLADLSAELGRKNEELEQKCTDLDNKLTDAYSLNHREAVIEVEKVRSELKRAFTYLYEEWLEYEFSDFSEENYESLQVIIQNSFRALKRNGIDFKERKL